MSLGWVSSLCASSWAPNRDYIKQLLCGSRPLSRSTSVREDVYNTGFLQFRCDQDHFELDADDADLDVDPLKHRIRRSLRSKFSNEAGDGCLVELDSHIPMVTVLGAVC